MGDTDALIADARLLARTGQGRMARESADVSIEALAAAVGVPVLQLMSWELGEVEPDGEAACDWVRVLRAHAHRHHG